METTNSTTKGRLAKVTPLQTTKTVSLIPAQADTLAANSVESVTDGPLLLFFRDCWTFVTMLKFFPGIFLPFYTNDPTQEFYLWNWNLFGLAVLVFGSVLELVLIGAAIPFILLFPMSGIFAIAIVLGGDQLVRLIFFPVQGGLTARSEDPRDPVALAAQQRYSSDERWMFLNGCCVTGDMLQQNLNVISKTFGRSVFAVHNRTYGLVGDILECIIQRSFRFYSQETRCAYEYVKSYCADPAVKKVVLIGHSQGGIMASEILDQLYQDLPRDCIAKMEVYTFGNAAIHFNNPLRKLGNHVLDKANGRSPTSLYTPTAVLSPKSPLNGNTKKVADTPPSAPEPSRVIPHIEHYCNSNDMVTRWGVLHSVKSILNNRFCGQIFVSENTSGHMLNQHYLSKMFPPIQPNTNGKGKTHVNKDSGVIPFLDRAVEINTAVNVRRDLETNKQLGIMRIDSMKHDARVVPGSPAAIGLAAAARRQATLDLEMGDETLVRDKDLKGEEGARLSFVKSNERFVKGHGKSVRDLSRLWRYMGGGNPE